MGLKSLEIRLKLLKIARQEICLSCGVARARMRYAAVASPRLTPLLSKPTAEPSEHLTHLDGVLTRRLLRHPLRNPFRSRRPRQEWDVLLEGVSHTAARVPTPRQFIRRSGKLSVQKRSKAKQAQAHFGVHISIGVSSDHDRPEQHRAQSCAIALALRSHASERTSDPKRRSSSRARSSSS